MLQREWSRIHASIKSTAQRRRYYACKILQEELRWEEPLMWKERICQWRHFGSMKSQRMARRKHCIAIILFVGQRMARRINESIESVFEKMIIIVVIQHLHNSELHLLWPMMCVWSCCCCSIIIDNKHRLMHSRIEWQCQQLWWFHNDSEGTRVILHNDIVKAASEIGYIDVGRNIEELFDLPISIHDNNGNAVACAIFTDIEDVSTTPANSCSTVGLTTALCKG